MDNNPYAPPGTPVGEPLPSAVPLVRPPQVTRAVQILWALYGFGLAMQAYNWSRFPRQEPAWATGIGTVIGALFAFWVYGRILRGRNWARILVLIGVLLAPFSLWFLTSRFAPATLPRTTIVLMVARVPVEFYVAWLLFLTPGKDWFARRHVIRGS